MGGKLTFLIGEWSSSLDPAVGSRVLTDDERKMAGLLQAIWPFNLAEQRSTRAWGEQGMSSMERVPCQTARWQWRACLNKRREWLSWHFELRTRELPCGSPVPRLITIFDPFRKNRDDFNETGQKKIRGNRSDRYGAREGCEEGEKCTHCLGSCEFALVHTNTHRPVTSAQSSDTRADKKDDREKNSLSCCQTVCLFMSGNTGKTKLKVRRWITSSQHNCRPVLT